MPPLQVADGNAVSRHGCVSYTFTHHIFSSVCLECIHAKCVICFCFTRRWHQRDREASLSVLNLLGLALRLCCLVLFFHVVLQRKNLKGIFVFFSYSVFLFLNLCPQGETGFAPSLDPIQSLGECLVSHSGCFGACPIQHGLSKVLSKGCCGLSEDIQSLQRGQNPSSGGKGYGAF